MYSYVAGWILGGKGDCVVVSVGWFFFRWVHVPLLAYFLFCFLWFSYNSFSCFFLERFQIHAGFVVYLLKSTSFMHGDCICLLVKSALDDCLTWFFGESLSLYGDGMASSWYFGIAPHRVLSIVKLLELSSKYKPNYM